MIAIGGAYTRYVKASLLPWLILTAVIVIALALVSMAADIRRGSGPTTITAATRIADPSPGC